MLNIIKYQSNFIYVFLLKLIKRKEQKMKKVAVITGCNRGVGEGVRNKLLEAGYQVYGINRTKTNVIEQTDSYKELICDVFKC